MVRAVLEPQRLHSVRAQNGASLEPELDVSCLQGMYPARGRAFIRHVRTEETYRGGSILIPEQARDKVAKQQFIVVSVGNYERCEDLEECNRPHTTKGEHKHRLNVGDWVLARNRLWDETPDPDIYVIRVCHILATFQETVCLSSAPSGSAAASSS